MHLRLPDHFYGSPLEATIPQFQRLDDFFSLGTLNDEALADLARLLLRHAPLADALVAAGGMVRHLFNPDMMPGLSLQPATSPSTTQQLHLQIEHTRVRDNKQQLQELQDWWQSDIDLAVQHLVSFDVT